VKVTLPLDGSPSSLRAVDYVLGLAQRIRSEPFEVDLVNVQDAAVGFSGLMGRDAADVGARLAARCKEIGDQVLAAPQERLRAAGVVARGVVLVGEPASSIAAHVERHGADAVVMGTRGLGTVGGLVLGSVATKVIHLVKPPVTLVK
jgi:nucleotide-binding universal stress UspA family protein